MDHKIYRNSIKKAIMAHAISKYDVFLFGFLGPIINPIFFFGTELIVSLNSFATFAAGYIMRPLGALFFSNIGDRKGRKIAFMLTIIIMAFPTLIIGILPGYAYIGIWAPIILLLCRLTHGFCAGGEFSGLSVYVTEFIPKQKLGFFGGIIRSAGFFGTAIGTFVASIMTLPFMPNWGWRITFIIGAILTFISYYLRKNIEETPDFERIKNENILESSPLLNIIKTYKKNILKSFCIGACAYIFFYISTIYLNSYYVTKFKVSNSLSLLISTITMIFWMVLTFLSGILADKIGIIKYLKIILTISFFIIFPIYYICNIFNNIDSLIILQLTLSLIGSLIFGPIAGLQKQIFETKIRFTGVAISNTLAQATLGGFAPFYSTLLISITHLEYAPVFILLFACILGLIGLRNLKPF